MSGYTPVFRSVFEGSLCGQYPDTAAWVFLLALQDKNGNIDMTPQYISAITGMPVEDLMACIERFMQPDPASRSDTEDGRRLVPIDPSRPWGWHVVNYMKYREKARKMGYDAARTESGADAARKRSSRDVPRSPAPSRSHTHTHTHTQTEEKAATPPVVPEGLNPSAWSRWVEYRKAKKKPIRAESIEAAMAEMAALGDDQEAAVLRSIAAGWQGLFPPTGRKEKAPAKWV